MERAVEIAESSLRNHKHELGHASMQPAIDNRDMQTRHRNMEPNTRNRIRDTGTHLKPHNGKRDITNAGSGPHK